MKSEMTYIRDYRATSNKHEEIVGEDIYMGLYRRFDKLENLITRGHDSLLRLRKDTFQPKYAFVLFLSSLISGVALCLTIFSIAKIISIGWPFFCSIFFASGGLSVSSLIILFGADYERYKKE